MKARTFLITALSITNTLCDTETGDARKKTTAVNKTISHFMPRKKYCLKTH